MDPTDSYIYKMQESVSIKERNKGRPVLVILDSVNRVDELSLLFPDCGIIKGINPISEREVISNAGKSGSLTIATLAAGRGMDIKLDENAKKSGGLHVIIPYHMPNIRCLEQAIGRSGRQGESGSASIYIDQLDEYDKTPEFHPISNYLMELQEDFSVYVKTDAPATKFFIYIEGADKNGKAFLKKIPAVSLKESNKWKQLRVEFRIPEAGVKNAYACFLITSTGKVWFDNAYLGSLENAPEPEGK